MSIGYEEALATLQSMFGEKWSRYDLDTVLRHHQGHMENTVDMILRHGEGSPETLLRQIEEGIDPRAQAVEADEALARQLSLAGRSSTMSISAKPKGRGTPTILPDDFLRLPSGVSYNSNQLSDDEALARMLQDQMFTEEVSRNPDLAHLARGRPRTSGGLPTGRMGAPRQQQQQQPEVDLLKSLGDLGNNAKRHLQSMAAQFNARMKAAQSNMAGGGGAHTGGGTGAAAGDAHERRGLLDDGDDGDEVALEFASRKDL